MDATLEDAGTDGLHVARVAVSHPNEGRRHLRGCDGVELREPISERNPAVAIGVGDNVQRGFEEWIK